MKIAIVEDEHLAAAKLEKMILNYDSGIEVTAKLSSVEEAVDWLKNNSTPDLLFLDIQLTDGTSFDIFQQVKVECPIIFTTAYDQYALDAFQLHSIDYLIKPISQQKLDAALNKLSNLTDVLSGQKSISEVLKAIKSSERGYKSRFLVKTGSTLKSIETKEISYLFSEDKLVFLMTLAGNRMVINETLDELEKLLDPSQFFRISRQFIVSFKSVSKVHQHFKGRLKVELVPKPADEIYISNRRASAFKSWMDQ